MLPKYLGNYLQVDIVQNVIVVEITFYQNIINQFGKTQSYIFRNFEH